MIGTLAKQAVAAGYDVAIVTSDKDFYQLVRDGVRVFNPRDDGTWYDPAGVREKFGVAPEHVVDVLALMGDTIDNIKGVPGIGEKGARELIQTYGSLENLIAHAAEIPQKRYREAMLANIEAARQSKELARIRTDVPVEFEPEALRYRGASRERCFQIFNELGFRALLAEFAPTADTITKTYRIVNTAEGVRAAGRSPASGRTIRAPCPVRPAVGDARSRSSASRFRPPPRDADYVPTGHRALGNTSCMPLAAALDALRPVLEDEAIRKNGHDLKFDAILLARHGVDAARARHRHDARQLPGRRHAGDAPRSRIWRSST